MTMKSMKNAETNFGGYWSDDFVQVIIEVGRADGKSL